MVTALVLRYCILSSQSLPACSDQSPVVLLPAISFALIKPYLSFFVLENIKKRKKKKENSAAPGAICYSRLAMHPGLALQLVPFCHLTMPRPACSVALFVSNSFLLSHVAVLLLKTYPPPPFSNSRFPCIQPRTVSTDFKFLYSFFLSFYLFVPLFHYYLFYHL